MNDFQKRMGKHRRELRLVEIKDKKFIVVLTWVPLQTSCGKTYNYWMSDTMWPDLERLIVDKCARVAGKDTWDNNTLHAIKSTATVGNLDVAIKFDVFVDSCLKEVMGVTFVDADSVADLTINVTVSYLGDKNYCKKILEERAFLKSSDAALPRTPTGKRPFAQLQNQNQAELLSPLPQSPQRVALSNHSPKHSSGHSSKFNLDTPPAKKKMVEKKKERTKTEAKDEKKKTKRVDSKRPKETESDKSQTKILSFFSPPPQKKKLPEIPCEFSPVKKPLVKVMKQAINIQSPTWDSPMPLVRKTSTETWDESQEEESPEIVGIIDTSKAANLARSPVKHSTPMRKHCKEEDIEISRLFPDPVDDDDYKLACKKLKKSFKKGDTDQVHSSVVETMYKVHLPYLKAIHDNKIPSLIRDEYKKSLLTHSREAHYADGGILFSFENLHIVIKLISKEFFDSGAEQNRHMNYTLGVLLPEFIARVVMSIYRENKEDAMKRIKDISIFLSDIQFEEF